MLIIDFFGSWFRKGESLETKSRNFLCDNNEKRRDHIPPYG